MNNYKSPYSVGMVLIGKRYVPAIRFDLAHAERDLTDFIPEGEGVILSGPHSQILSFRLRDRERSLILTRATEETLYDLFNEDQPHYPERATENPHGLIKLRLWRL